MSSLSSPSTPRSSLSSGSSLISVQRPRYSKELGVNRAAGQARLEELKSAPAPLKETLSVQKMAERIQEYLEHSAKEDNTLSFHLDSEDVMRDVLNALPEELRMKYMFDEQAGTFIVYPAPRFEHETFCVFLASRIERDMQDKYEACMKSEAPLQGIGASGVFLKEKDNDPSPDGGLSLCLDGPEYPLYILVEVGLSQVYKDVLRRTSMWLWKTDKVVAVIAVNVEKPKAEEDQYNPEKWKGFWQIFQRRQEGKETRPDADELDQLGIEKLWEPVKFLPKAEPAAVDLDLWRLLQSDCNIQKVRIDVTRLTRMMARAIWMSERAKQERDKVKRARDQEQEGKEDGAGAGGSTKRVKLAAK